MVSKAALLRRAFEAIYQSNCGYYQQTSITLCSTHTHATLWRSTPHCPRLVRRLLNGQGGLRVRGPERALSDDMVSWLREHIQELMEALRDRQKARKKRSAILEYITALHANKRMLRSAKRIRFVTCENYSNGAGQSSCGARMLTSGDPFPRARARLCGFHTPRRKQ
jgi:hypothetical protein